MKVKVQFPFKYGVSREPITIDVDSNTTIAQCKLDIVTAYNNGGKKGDQIAVQDFLLLLPKGHKSDTKMSTIFPHAKELTFNMTMKLVDGKPKFSCQEPQVVAKDDFVGDETTLSGEEDFNGKEDTSITNPSDLTEQLLEKNEDDMEEVDLKDDSTEQTTSCWASFFCCCRGKKAVEAINTESKADKPQLVIMNNL